MRLRLPTINHRLPTCQPTARMCGLLDRVGGALVDERERLELKAIEMLKDVLTWVAPGITSRTQRGFSYSFE